MTQLTITKPIYGWANLNLISLYPKEWDLFYESEGARVSSLLDQIKENCPEVIK